MRKTRKLFRDVPHHGHPRSFKRDIQFNSVGMAKGCFDYMEPVRRQGPNTFCRRWDVVENELRGPYLLRDVLNPRACELSTHRIGRRRITA